MLAWNFTALCGVVLWKGEMMHPRPSVREGCYYLFPQQIFGRSIILRVLEVMEPSTEILRGTFEGHFEEPGLWCQFPTERMIQPYLVLFLTVSVSAARTRGRFSWHWPLAIIQSRTKTLGFWAQLLNQLPDAAYCQLFKRSSWPLSRPCRLPDLRDPFSGVETLTQELQLRSSQRSFWNLESAPCFLLSFVPDLHLGPLQGAHSPCSISEQGQDTAWPPMDK